MDLRAILNDVDDAERPRARGAHETDPRHGLSRLTRLPAIIHKSITSHLPNRDIKSLRLTCKFFHGIACLRLHRVFISAHEQDIQVLHAIADSETFRHDVTELIWDDARLINSSHLTPGSRKVGSYEDSVADSGDGGQVPEWFTNERYRSIEDVTRRIDIPPNLRSERHGVLGEKLFRRLRPSACWVLYRLLSRQEAAALASGDDEAAFRHALQRFPSLRRLTITPAAHGWLFEPLFETPFIRSLPQGFVYPMPRGWPTIRDGWAPCMRRWPDDDTDAEGEAYKDQWRGVRLALRVLAEPQVTHAVKELILTAHHLDTGINCRIFEWPAHSAEYANFCALLRRPGFSRLDLDLAVKCADGIWWTALGGRQLRAALACAPSLTHLTLRTNMDTLLDKTYRIPLRNIVPVDDASWGTRIRHFGLSGFLVEDSDVVALLKALPPSLRSVELSFLHFLRRRGGHWHGLLEQMLCRLGWREREAAFRPAVVVAHEGKEKGRVSGTAVWAGREAVDGFLYGDRPNPFEEPLRNPFGDPIGYGELYCRPNDIMVYFEGCVKRDEFNPAYERPYVNDSILTTLGIHIS